MVARGGTRLCLPAYSSDQRYARAVTGAGFPFAQVDHIHAPVGQPSSLFVDPLLTETNRGAYPCNSDHGEYK